MTTYDIIITQHYHDFTNSNNFEIINLTNTAKG